MQQNQIYFPVISHTPVIIKQKCQSLGNINIEDLNQAILRTEFNSTPHNRRKQLYHEDLNKQHETPNLRFKRQQINQICQSDRKLQPQNGDDNQSIFLRFIRREKNMRETKLKQLFGAKLEDRTFSKIRRHNHDNQKQNDEINLHNNKKVRFNPEVQAKLEDGSIITQQIQDYSPKPFRRRLIRSQLPTIN